MPNNDERYGCFYVRKININDEFLVKVGDNIIVEFFIVRSIFFFLVLVIHIANIKIRTRTFCFIRLKTVLQRLVL